MAHCRRYIFPDWRLSRRHLWMLWWSLLLWLSPRWLWEDCWMTCDYTNEREMEGGRRNDKIIYFQLIDQHTTHGLPITAVAVAIVAPLICAMQLPGGVELGICFFCCCCFCWSCDTFQRIPNVDFSWMLQNEAFAFRVNSLVWSFAYGVICLQFVYLHGFIHIT